MSEANEPESTLDVELKGKNRKQEMWFGIPGTIVQSPAERNNIQNYVYKIHAMRSFLIINSESFFSFSSSFFFSSSPVCKRVFLR